MRRGMAVDREDVDALAIGEVAQVLIQPLHKACPRAGKAVLVVTDQRRENWQYRLLDNLGAEGVARNAPLSDQVVSNHIEPLFDEIRRLGGSKTTQNMPRVQSKEDDRWRPMLEGRVRVGERLRILPVFTLPGRDPNAAPKGADANSS
jgi:hypothetical protein